MCDRRGVDELKRNETSDEAVTIRRRAVVLDRVDAGFFDISNGQDFVRVARAEYEGKPLNLEDRFEDGEGLVDGDFGWGDDRDATAYSIVVDEVVSRQPGNCVDDHGKLDICEVEGNEFLFVRGLGKACQRDR